MHKILALSIIDVSAKASEMFLREPEDIASPTATKNTVTSPCPQRISGVLNCFLEKSQDQEALVLSPIESSLRFWTEDRR